METEVMQCQVTVKQEVERSDRAIEKELRELTMSSVKTILETSSQLIHTNKKLYQCNLCNKQFQYKSKFKIHQIIHTGEKPYECSQCSKSFTRKQTLVSHQLAHKGEKPHACIYCIRK